MVIEKIRKKNDQIEEWYIYKEDEPHNKRLIYIFNSINKTIIARAIDYFKEIKLEGFTSLPNQFSEKGYLKNGLAYIIYKQFNDMKLSIENIKISKNNKSKVKKNKNKVDLTFNFDDFQNLYKRISKSRAEGKFEVNSEGNLELSRIFNEIKQKENSNYRKIEKIFNNLDEEIIEDLNKENVTKLLDFLEKMLDTKYSSEIHKRKLLNMTKLKVDSVAIDAIISKFEKMLKEKNSESEWGDFLKEYLFLIDSKYIKVIPELNVILCGSRKVDFGLIDSQGYLDLFEIKKPETKILSSKTDRGNYYWSSELVKAITQIEKYLYNAEKKAPSLNEDIKRETDITVQVIRPKAFLIVGNSKQLNDSKKKEDFKILRSSLKNVEIILYDELLERIVNQKKKIFL